MVLHPNVLQLFIPKPVSPFEGNGWISLVDAKKPPGKPGIAIYFSSKTTKKDTYVPKPELRDPQAKDLGPHQDPSQPVVFVFWR